MVPISETSSFQTSDELTEKYKKILKLNGIENEVSDVIVKDAGLQGEGFASATRLVTVKFANPKVNDLNLFVKMHTQSASHTAMIEDLKAFEKESRFLTEYVPAAEKFCRSRGLEGFIDFYPKCYFGDDKMIVLENIVLDKGFFLVKKEEMQDLEAARFSVKTLAKHHALSYAMIQEAGGAKKFFERFQNLNFEALETEGFEMIFRSTLDNAITTNIQILETNQVNGNVEASNILKKYIGRPMELFMNAIKYKTEEELLLVLCHGDYWNNNMMFRKDSNTGKIIEHVAIDFQITRYNVPSSDLTYYLFTSVKPEVRQAHLRDLLNLYLETLQQAVFYMGYRINLTEEQLFREFRRKIDGGFWLGMCTACAPALEVKKDIDVNTIDVQDWANEFSKKVEQWLGNHPEEGKAIAESLVKIVNEYETLSLNK